MYFPYLRGRQFELIAIREFAFQRGDKNNVFPIIEPVKKTFNSLKKAIKILNDAEVQFALILNPQNGELKSNNSFFNEIIDDLKSVNWTPAYIVKNNIKEIEESMSQHEFSNVMLICTKMADSSSEEFFNILTSEKVKYIVSEENKSLKRKLRREDKDIVLLSDCFEPKKRNKDYLEAPEEKFTEEHLFYEEESYFGFSDYTTVSSEFVEGGSTPYAVAIHLTYQKENDEIWIRHFTSTSNEDQANIQGKFAEAAKKAVQFLDKYNIHTNSADELREYYRNAKYPGLGMVKKISIKNHLEIINSIL